MEKRSTAPHDLVARLHHVENELHSLRATISRQSRVAPNSYPTLLSQLKNTAVACYLAASRVLNRADVRQVFDRDYYVSRVPGLVESGLDPVFHYLRSKPVVSAHWLFDGSYYLRTYPDVARARVHPLVHFLRTGWREGRNPHPLFNTNFYLNQAPHLKAGQLNPVTHYLKTGWREKLRPHPLFDGEFYLDTQRDIAAAGIDPLTHYLLFGAYEGRAPHPWFDIAYYCSRNPDVIRTRSEPVQHYIEHGAAEGRNPHPLFNTSFYEQEAGIALGGLSPLEHFILYGRAEGRPIVSTDRVDRFLPAVPHPVTPPRNRIVDIIIPVYRGLRETRACIESVLGTLHKEPFELIVIDDLSPEPELSAWLRQASATHVFTLLENENNLGFVATVNRGMSLHSERDILLLNSDTVVANDWLDRLVRAAYREDRIGTVTPFSNNATICSYPRFCEDNSLPPDTTCAEIDDVTAQVNAGRTVDIPTAVGFCMYIRRECLAEVGLFDVETFGKGYGEENDFSLRAAARGWRNILAADVFVYHAGSVSFSENAILLRDSGVRAVTDRYPHYPALISRHVALDPALPFRFALTASLTNGQRIDAEKTQVSH